MIKAILEKTPSKSARFFRKKNENDKKPIFITKKKSESLTSKMIKKNPLFDEENFLIKKSLEVETFKKTPELTQRNSSLPTDLPSDILFSERPFSKKLYNSRNSSKYIFSVMKTQRLASKETPKKKYRKNKIEGEDDMIAVVKDSVSKKKKKDFFEDLTFNQLRNQIEEEKSKQFQQIKSSEISGEDALFQENMKPYSLFSQKRNNLQLNLTENSTHLLPIEQNLQNNLVKTPLDQKSESVKGIHSSSESDFIQNFNKKIFLTEEKNDKEDSQINKKSFDEKLEEKKTRKLTINTSKPLIDPTSNNSNELSSIKTGKASPFNIVSSARINEKKSILIQKEPKAIKDALPSPKDSMNEKLKSAALISFQKSLGRSGSSADLINRLSTLDLFSFTAQDKCTEECLQSCLDRINPNLAPKGSMQVNDLWTRSYARSIERQSEMEEYKKTMEKVVANRAGKTRVKNKMSEKQMLKNSKGINPIILTGQKETELREKIFLSTIHDMREELVEKRGERLKTGELRSQGVIVERLKKKINMKSNKSSFTTQKSFKRNELEGVAKELQNFIPLKK